MFNISLIRSIIFLCLSLFVTLPGFGNEFIDNEISAVVKYQKMSNEKLLDIANNFIKDNQEDSALVCYILIYNRKINSNNSESVKSVYKALNDAAQIYYKHCDYKSSLELLLRALKLAEQISDTVYMSLIYNNIGNIHYAFRESKTAEKYYRLAYRYNDGKHSLSVALNNLGMSAYHKRDIDSALLCLKQSYDVKLKNNDSLVCDQLSNIGLMYQVLGKRDSAYYYYVKALDNAKKFNLDEKSAQFLSNMGVLFFEADKYDSALKYLYNSNNLAEKRKFLGIMSKNLYYLAEIEYHKGNIHKMYQYNKQYYRIKDSIFSISKYGNINELQFLYDMSKVNDQIVKLNLDQEIKEQTIERQRNLQLLGLSVMLIIVIFLFIIYSKNRRLNKAYMDLGFRNLEIVKSDKESKLLIDRYINIIKEKDEIISKIKDDNGLIFDEGTNEINEHISKYRKRILKDDHKNELLNSIIDIMNDSDIFCDPDFSLNRLSDMVGSNSSYVSQVINDTFGKNFRTFINEYRIKQARVILSDTMGQKYSIASIAAMVGFKSKGTFNLTFKEVTGITPSSYIASLKDIQS